MARGNSTYNSRRVKGSYFTSTISISLVLVMLGLVGLLFLNSRKLSEYVKENLGFTIFLKDDAREIDIIHLKKSIDASNYTRIAKYISPAEAAERMQKQLGEDFIGILGYNPLMPSIEVKLKADFANNDSISKIEKEYKDNAIISEVAYEKSWIQQVNENVRNISLIMLIIGSIFGLIAVALINNTIRLSIYSRRFIIRTMQLVGATNGFIRKPFLIKSIIQGLLASIIAMVIILLLLSFIQQQIQDIVILADMHMLILLTFFISGLGMFINLIFTFFAVSRYLNLKQDDLY